MPKNKDFGIRNVPNAKIFILLALGTFSTPKSLFFLLFGIGNVPNAKKLKILALETFPMPKYIIFFLFWRRERSWCQKIKNWHRERFQCQNLYFFGIGNVFDQGVHACDDIILQLHHGDGRDDAHHRFFVRASRHKW